MVIGLEIIGATERYRLEDIFNLSTENLIFKEMSNHQRDMKRGGSY